MTLNDITIAGAETYFAVANHPQANVWGRFDDNRKAAAFAHAKRQLQRKLGLTRTIVLVDGDYDDDDYLRLDYAIYEQALWILINSPMTNADETLPIPEAHDPEADNKTRQAQLAEIAPEALRWLVKDGVVTFSRG